MLTPCCTKLIKTDFCKTPFRLWWCRLWQRQSIQWITSKKLESVQYNATLVMTAAIRETNTEKPYQELV